MEASGNETVVQLLLDNILKGNEIEWKGKLAVYENTPQMKLIVKELQELVHSGIEFETYELKNPIPIPHLRMELCIGERTIERYITSREMRRLAQYGISDDVGLGEIEVLWPRRHDVVVGNIVAQIDCPYKCKKFYQSCQWHEDFLDAKVMNLRQKFYLENKHRMKWWKFWSGFYGVEILHQLMHVIPWKREVKPGVIQGFGEVNLGAKTTDWVASMYQNTTNAVGVRIDELIILMQQVLGLAQGVATMLKATLRRLIINIVMAIVTIVASPTMVVVTAQIALIINELLSVVGTDLVWEVKKLGADLMKVIKRFITPRAQAMPTADQDNVVANESIIQTLMNIITSMIPGISVDAGLLKARMARIESLSKCLHYTKTIYEWFKKLGERLFDWIQIYIFGRTKEEVDAMYNTVSRKIYPWINRVRAFEGSDGKSDSKITLLSTNEEVQRELKEIRKEGEDYLIELSRNDKGAKLTGIVQRYMGNVNCWYKQIEIGMAGSVPKHTPYILCLSGEAGCGKTYAIDYIARILLGSIGETYDPNKDRFQKPRESSYWEGYTGQKLYVIDDFLQVKDDALWKEDLGSIIDFGSRATTPLNMSEATSKGRVYFTSKLLIMTTNLAPGNHQLEAHLVSADAYQRRINAKVCVHAGGWIDKTKKFDQDHYEMDITINGKDFKKLKWKDTMEILVEEFVKHEIAEANLDIMEEMSNTDKEIIERAKQKYGIGNAQGLITCAKCSQEFEEIPEWGDHIIECNHEGTVWDCPNCPVCLEILDTLDKLNNHIELFGELHPGHNMEEWIENQFDLKYKDFFDAFTSKCKLDKKYFEFMSKQAQEGLDYPQPIPWSLAQCVMYNWEYGCRKYLEAHENQKTTWNQIKRKFREGYHYIRSVPQSWRERVYGRVDVVFQAIEEMKESLNKVSRFAQIFVMSGAIMSLGLAGLAIWKTRTNENKDTRMAIKEVPGGIELEGFVSGSARVATKKKKRMNVEGFVSGSSKIAAKRKGLRMKIEAGKPIRIAGSCKPILQDYVVTYVERDGDVNVNFVGNSQAVKISIDGKDEEIQPLEGKCNWRAISDYIIKEIQAEEEEAQMESQRDIDEKVERILENGKPQMEGSRDPNLYSVMLSFTNNMAFVTSSLSGMKMRGIFIGGRILMTPSHLIGPDASRVDKEEITVTTIRGTQTYKLAGLRTKFCADRDLLFIELPDDLPPFKCLRNRFWQRGEAESFYENGYMILPEGDKKIDAVIHRQLREIQYQTEIQYTGHNKIYKLNGLSYSSDTQNGDCGAVVFRIAPSESRKAMGIHVAGASGVGYATVVTSELIEEIIQEFATIQGEEFYDVVESFEEYADVESFQEFFDVVAEDDVLKCGTRQDLIGKVSRLDSPPLPSISRLRQSPLFGRVTESLTKPAHLRPFEKEDGTKINPMKKAISKLEIPQIVLDPDVRKVALQSMRRKYGRVKSCILYHANGLLTQEEVLNGIEGEDYIRPMNMHTSPGYPYHLRGGKLCFVEEKDGLLENKESLQKMVDLRERRGKRGLFTPAYIVDSLKDERLPVEKVDEGKTRIFSNCPFDFNQLMRKYFLKFMAHLMENHVQEEVSVGLNVHNDEWGVLWKRLKAKGPNIVAGDYGGWDKRTPYQLAIDVLEVVEDFYKKFDDWTEDARRMRRVLIEQSFQSTRIVPGREGAIIYRVFQSMPSGIPLTAVFNSMINSLLFRCIFISLAKKNDIGIDEAANMYDNHITFVAYGDDHVVKVSRSTAGWFNMITIQKEMEAYGIEYTTPSKTAVTQPFIKEEELTYLKRYFVDRNGYIDAPMDEKKVLDILNWVHVRHEAEIGEAVKSSIMSVLIELTHFEKSTYEKWVSIIQEQANHLGVSYPIMNYETARRKRLEKKSDAIDPELLE